MNRDLSLLDANLARAREGLRVLEDSARFVLGSKNIASTLKTARHTIRDLENSFGGPVLLVGRFNGESTPNTPTPQENIRYNLLHIIRANSNRVSEALRNLEEFAKIYAPESIALIAGLRYQLYQIEVDLARLTPHWWLEWYNIAGFIYPLSAEPANLIRHIQKGARVVQLRNKDCSKLEYAKKLEALLEFTNHFNKTNDAEKVLVFVNDYVDIASRYPVAGVHIGQGDGGVAVARAQLGSNKIIGRSNNTIDQLKNSLRDGADYVSFGPVFATPNKPDRTPTGLENLSHAASLASVPLVAIGGVHKTNISGVYEAGAKNIAVISSADQFFD